METPKGHIPPQPMPMPSPVDGIRRITFSALRSGKYAHLMPAYDETMKTIIITGPQASGKTLNAQALAEHFGCNLIVEDWDGVTPLPNGSLVLTNNETFDQSLADEIHDIDSALLAIQNKTVNEDNSASLSR